jgi:hypothetical protein
MSSCPEARRDCYQTIGGHIYPCPLYMNTRHLAVPLETASTTSLDTRFSTPALPCEVYYSVEAILLITDELEYTFGARDMVIFLAVAVYYPYCR